MGLLRKLTALLKGTTAVAPFMEYTATICGHKSRGKGRIDAFDEWVETTLPINDRGSIDYCLECIGKMAIRCAWCTKPIFIGDPVTLYSPTNKDFVLPEHAVLHSEKTGSVVGCLRWECADTGADRAGFWVPGPNGKGRVERVPSPIELAMASGQPVVMNDLQSPTEALTLTAAIAKAAEKEETRH